MSKPENNESVVENIKKKLVPIAPATAENSMIFSKLKAAVAPPNPSEMSASNNKILNVFKSFIRSKKEKAPSNEEIMEKIGKKTENVQYKSDDDKLVNAFKTMMNEKRDNQNHRNRHASAEIKQNHPQRSETHYNPFQIPPTFQNLPQYHPQLSLPTNNGNNMLVALLINMLQTQMLSASSKPSQNEHLVPLIMDLQKQQYEILQKINGNEKNSLLDKPFADKSDVTNIVSLLQNILSETKAKTIPKNSSNTSIVHNGNEQSLINSFILFYVLQQQYNLFSRNKLSEKDMIELFSKIQNNNKINNLLNSIQNNIINTPTAKQENSNSKPKNKNNNSASNEKQFSNNPKGNANIQVNTIHVNNVKINTQNNVVNANEINENAKNNLSKNAKNNPSKNENNILKMKANNEKNVVNNDTNVSKNDEKVQNQENSAEQQKVNNSDNSMHPVVQKDIEKLQKVVQKTKPTQKTFFNKAYTQLLNILGKETNPKNQESSSIESKEDVLDNAVEEQ